MAMPVIAYLGLGSNLGDRLANLVAGVRLLVAVEGAAPRPGTGLDGGSAGTGPESGPARAAGTAGTADTAGNASITDTSGTAGTADTTGTPGDIALVAVSSVYETAPWGRTDQPPFLNAVCAVRTTLSPEALLQRCLTVEQALGRVRTVRWGPRTLDIDLLLYGDRTLAEPHLTVPHPRMTQRAFVVIPLLEIAPNLVLPGGEPLVGFRAAVADQGVALWQPAATFWRLIHEAGSRTRP